MDQKTLQTLEYPKVLERLAAHCAFPPSVERAQLLQPVNDIEHALRLQAETSEALRLLSNRPDQTIGGARDIRGQVDFAQHAGVLTPMDLLDIKSTLLAARNLNSLFNRLADAYPNLSRIAAQMLPPLHLVEAISSSISDRGEILDSASMTLAAVRRDLRTIHDRLLTKLQRIISDPKNAPLLQETLITQRDGRYVLPLRAEFKGRIHSIVHDQSSSGATLFIEPLAVVDLNNQYRELQLAERDEEHRILSHLSLMVGEHGEEILVTIETIAELDLVFSKAKYSQDTAAVEPVLHPFPKATDTKHPGSVLKLYAARHPLLDPNTVVPVDLELDSQTYGLIITGPNTGGKTVTLKIAGLLALMAQSGLHIPAQAGSEMSVFDNIFADIGDEQSIEQSLSTFSGHITNIVHLLQKADRRSLVILDELGAGTDPQEGAALARALLSHLLERGITTLVTTHHPELKAYAHAVPGVINASTEFDLETLRPTYRLSMGLPGRSNAIAIAQRLGMPDEIIQASRADLDPVDLQVEDLLDEIHRQRDRSRTTRIEAEKALREAETIRTQLAERLEKIEEERRLTLQNASDEAESQLRELQSEVRQLRRELARARQPLQAIEAIQKNIEQLETHVIKPVERDEPEFLTPSGKRIIHLGDKVLLRSLNTKGVVTSLSEDEAEVQVGVLRVRARLADLQSVSAQEEGSPSESIEQAHIPRDRATSFDLPVSPGIELDLRGQHADEALDALDRYLDSAYLAGLPWVRIIHGKGTGKLRQAVRLALNQHPHVSSVSAGDEKEGGDGVTVAKLRLN